MRTSITNADKLHIYVPLGANFSECAAIIEARCGGYTKWQAYGAWKGVHEWVKVFEVITDAHTGEALAKELSERYLKDNPGEAEFMVVVTNVFGVQRHSFFHN